MTIRGGSFTTYCRFNVLNIKLCVVKDLHDSSACDGLSVTDYCVLAKPFVGDIVSPKPSLCFHNNTVVYCFTWGSFRVRSTNGLRVTPPISIKFGTRADNA